MTTNRVTLTITSTDEVAGYKQVTTRNVVVDEVPLEVIQRECGDFADRLRRQDRLPLDTGDADPASVTALRAVPDPDVQDVLDEHDADALVADGDEYPNDEEDDDA